MNVTYLHRERQAETIESRPDRRLSGVRRMGQRSGIILIGLVLAVLLALPGETLVSKYLNDLLIFLDGAYRISLGQVPNVDFHTSLGPLAFYIPAMGYMLTGSLGAAMPLGMAIMLVLTSIVAAEVIASRLRWTIGLPMAIYLLLILAVPANPGELIGEIAYAMFYNRIGWTALGLLFLLYLPRREPSPGANLRDAVCAAFLVLFMLFTKITYGLVGLGFLAFMLTDLRQWRWVVGSIALTVATGLGMLLFWGGGPMHLADLELASAVSGGIPTIAALRDVLIRNLTDTGSFLVFAGLLVALRRHWRDVLFLGYVLVTGVLLIEQNFQAIGIMTLASAGAVAAERLLDGLVVQRARSLLAGLPLLLAVVVLPPSIGNLANLCLHAGMAFAGEGEAVPLANFDGVKLVPPLTPGSFGRFQRYDQSIADGAAGLRALDRPAERVAVFDFVNPFTAGMGLKPPVRDSAWYHWGRTINGAHFPAADEIFRDVDIIMQPKVPIERFTAEGMTRIYAPYVSAHFDQVADTKDWRIFRRK